MFTWQLVCGEIHVKNKTNMKWLSDNVKKKKYLYAACCYAFPALPQLISAYKHIYIYI